jgi:hypothetical protein
MAQRVHGHALVGVRGPGGRVNGTVQLSRAQLKLIERIEPGKQPSAIEHLALLDTLCHAFAVDVGDLQRDHFAGA